MANEVVPRSSAAARLAAMRFGVLGTLEVSDHRGPLALGKPQQRAVLAMLVLEANRVVSLERIVEDMWDGSPPARAAGTVHACISILRRILEPDRSARTAATVLVSQAPGYLLRVEPDDVDAVRFERLAADANSLTRADPERAIATFDAALGLWRGPALADFATLPWAAVAATRLEEIRTSVAEDRFDALLAAGHAQGVVADLEAAVSLSPLRERLWSQLIVSLYRSGRQADALRAYQRARTVLAEELGIEPGPELQTLERQVLEQSSDLDANRREPSRASITTPRELPPAAAAGGTRGTESIFGRERELLTLRTAVANLRGGVGSAVAVTGTAGAGKTRLVEAGLGDGADQVRVMWARCVQGDIAPALWPWLQFAAALGNDGTELADAIRTEPGSGPPGETAQRLMYEAAVRALTRLGPPPVVLAMDDAQWADAASLHIVQLLVSRLPDLALLLVLTVRDGDQSSSETATTLAAIARSPAGHRTEVGSLDEGAIAQLLAAKLGRPAAPEITALVHERSGGNAFYATELVRLLSVDADDPAALPRAVPASVRDVVSGRVDALSDEARSSLAAAAVLGRDFDTRIVQRLTGLSPIACLEAFDLATVAGIIEQGSSATRHQFAHDLTREAVYEETPRARRAELHAAAVDALTDFYGDDPSRTIEIAAHAWAGRQVIDPAAVIEQLISASRAALGGYANQRSEHLLNRAIEVAQDLTDRRARDEIELELAIRLAFLSAVTLGYGHQETAQLFERAIDLHARLESTSAISPDMLMEVSAYLSMQGRIQQAADVADELIVSAHHREDQLAECAGNSALALASWHLGDVARTATAVGRAVELGRGIPRSALTATFGFPQLGNWLSFLALVRTAQGDLDGARTAIAESRSELERFPDPMSAMWADAFSSWRAIMDDDPVAARRRCARFMALAEKTATGVVQPQADVVDGWARVRLGDGQAGLQRIRAGRVGIPKALVFVGVALEVEALVVLGRAAEALDVIEGSLGTRDEFDPALWLPEVHRWRGELLAPTDRAEADGEFARAIEIATAQGAYLLVERAKASRLRVQ